MKPSVSLFYDYEPDGSKRPLWVGLNFGFEGVPWTQNSLYLNIKSFEEQDIYDFFDEYVGCSVFLSELLASPNEGELGINLQAIYERVKSSFDPINIDRLMIQVADAVEVGAIGKEIF